MSWLQKKPHQRFLVSPTSDGPERCWSPLKGNGSINLSPTALRGSQWPGQELRAGIRTHTIISSPVLGWMLPSSSSHRRHARLPPALPLTALTCPPCSGLCLAPFCKPHPGREQGTPRPWPCSIPFAFLHDPCAVAAWIPVPHSQRRADPFWLFLTPHPHSSPLYPNMEQRLSPRPLLSAPSSDPVDFLL